jgi:hypothetical protein
MVTSIQADFFEGMGVTEKMDDEGGRIKEEARGGREGRRTRGPEAMR